MIKRLLARKFSLSSGRSSPLRPWLNRLTWSGDSALGDFGSTGWIYPALFKLATFCNGLLRLGQFFDDFLILLGLFCHLMHFATYSLGHSLHFAIYSLSHFKDEFDHFRTWPLFAHGNWLHFAIYSLGHFKNKLSHSCTWLIFTWPLISFGQLFTWLLFALGQHFKLANHWTWTLSLSNSLG